MMTTKSADPGNFDPVRFTKLRLSASGGESDRLEFKRKVSHPEKIVRELVAFANASGGVLLVGVDDNGALPGLKFPDEDAYVIRRAIARYCRPRLRYTVETIAVSDSRYVLQYTVEESRRKPHDLVFSRTHRESYVRVADRSIKASREVREIARRRRMDGNHGFTFGEHEKMLFTYLDENKTITLTKFIQITGLQPFPASNTLIQLVLTRVLRVSPHEKGDIYSFGFSGR